MGAGGGAAPGGGGAEPGGGAGGGLVWAVAAAMPAASIARMAVMRNKAVHRIMSTLSRCFRETDDYKPMPPAQSPSPAPPFRSKKAARVV